MRLITFLGTGNYAETRYTFNGQECQTRYVAAALATFLQADEITVLATEQAYASHAQGLIDELERLQLPRPIIRRIPSGGNTEELWQQFKIISDAVTAGSVAQVSFDITHGFRAQPFFAAAVINYLRSTLDIVPAMQAFYGEWRKDKASSPIWDISTFIGLLNWSSSLQSFMKTGHGAGLATLARQENAAIQKAGQGKDNRPTTLASLAEAIRAFSDNISTVRVPQIITGKERGSASDVLAKIAQSEAEVRTHFMPLFPVLEQLKAKLQAIPADLLFSQQGYQAMLALAKLYVSYERYPEAAVVLREGWISLYSQPELLAPLSKEGREAAEKAWYDAEGQAAKGDADLLSSVRNDIQHGGFRSNPTPADKLIKNLSELIVKFENKLNEADES